MSFIKSKLEEQILTVEFGDTTSRNSFSLRAAEELKAILDQNRSKFGALVFTAPGRVFCSGGNLTDYAAMTSPEEGKRVNRKIAAILDEVSRLPVPTVCAVTGDCFGGGVELISAFDVVLSVPHAMFALWQRKIGLSFGWGGGKRLESRLGIHKLRQLALSANSFSALEAMKLGLIDAVSIDEHLLEDARACAMGMRALPKAPVASLKSYTPEKEKEMFESLWLNEEHAKVLAGKKK